MIFSNGQLVWTLLLNYPPWPAIIIGNVVEDDQLYYNVKFFGEATTAYYLSKDLRDYRSQRQTLMTKNNPIIRKAVKQADRFLKKRQLLLSNGRKPIKTIKSEEQQLLIEYITEQISAKKKSRRSNKQNNKLYPELQEIDKTSYQKSKNQSNHKLPNNADIHNQQNKSNKQENLNDFNNKITSQNQVDINNSPHQKKIYFKVHCQLQFNLLLLERPQMNFSLQSLKQEIKKSIKHTTQALEQLTIYNLFFSKISNLLVYIRTLLTHIDPQQQIYSEQSNQISLKIQAIEQKLKKHFTNQEEISNYIIQNIEF